MSLIAGTIVAWVGNNLGEVPDNWLYCNGNSVTAKNYPLLFAAIGTTFGSSQDPPSFNLPDLRGYFVRGVDDGAGNDPDAGERTSQWGGNGNTGDMVGTVQSDQFSAHTHALSGMGFQSGGNYPCVNVGTGAATGAAGGDETRPLNLYAYYLIYTGVDAG